MKQLFVLFTSILVFNAVASDCANYKKGKLEFLKIDSRKFPNEQLVLGIDVDQNCSIKYNPKVNNYWSSKVKNNCYAPAKIIKKLAKPSKIVQISRDTYDLTIDAFYTATKRLKTPLDRVVRLKTFKSAKGCKIETWMKVGKVRNYNMKVKELFVNKSSISFTFDPVFKSGFISGMLRTTIKGIVKSGNKKIEFK